MPTQLITNENHWRAKTHYNFDTNKAIRRHMLQILPRKNQHELYVLGIVCWNNYGEYARIEFRPIKQLPILSSQVYNDKLNQERLKNGGENHVLTYLSFSKQNWQKHVWWQEHLSNDSKKYLDQSPAWRNQLPSCD